MSKRKHPFVNLESERRRRAFSATPVSHSECLFLPQGSLDLSKDKVVTFNIQSGMDSIRFYKHAIQIQYRTEIKAPNVFRKTVATDNLYLSPLLGASSFIRGVEVFVNNVPIYSDLTGMHNCYQAIQTRMCSRKFRDALVEISPLENTTAEFKYVKYSTDFETQTDKILVGTLPGVPFLGPSRNSSLESMAAKTQGVVKGLDDDCFILPPHAELTVRFTLHEDSGTRIFKSDSKRSSYLVEDMKDPGAGADVSDADKAAFNNWKAEANANAVKVVIKSFKLRGVKYRFQEKEVNNALESSSLTFLYDRPLAAIHALQPNAQHLSVEFQVPKSCHVVYVAFLPNHAIMTDSKLKRPSDCTKFSLPVGLTKAYFKLDEQVIIWQEGIEIQNSEGSRSEGVRLYFDYLRRNGLVDEHLTFKDFCPEGIDQHSFNFVFVVPLLEFERSETAKLNVELTFDGETNSPAGYSLVTFTPQEKAIKRTKGFWEVESI